MALTAGSVGGLASALRAWLASPAWIASAVIHGSLVAILAVQAGKPHVTEGPVLIDVQLTTVELPPELPPPPVEVLPALATPTLAPPVTLQPVAAPMTPRASAPAPEPLQRAAAITQQMAPPPEVTTAPAAPPTFVMSMPIGASTGTASSTSANDMGTAKAVEAPTKTVLDENGVSTRAEVAFGPTPVYPTAARAAQVELDVPVELVVDEVGRVAEARVLRHAGFGLDEAALDAIRRYRFTPAQRDGHAVAVRMRWTMQFRLE